MKVTKEEFQTYEDCRMSGVTNMFAVDVVSSITGLKKEKILYIMKNYTQLFEEYIK